MNLILKQLIIISFTFIIIWWFQDIDDKRHNKVRETFYERYKFPLLVSAIIGLVINISDMIGIISCTEQCEENIGSISIFTAVEPQKQIQPVSIFNKLPNLYSHNIASDQQIYTSLPDF
jgi:hypothetical protein